MENDGKPERRAALFETVNTYYDLEIIDSLVLGVVFLYLEKLGIQSSDYTYALVRDLYFLAFQTYGNRNEEQMMKHLMQPNTVMVLELLKMLGGSIIVEKEDEDEPNKLSSVDQEAFHFKKLSGSVANYTAEEYLFERFQIDTNSSS